MIPYNLPRVNQCGFIELKNRGVDLNIFLLASNLDERCEAELLALRTETDEFRVRGREIYWSRRKKPGTSLFATVLLGEGTPRAVYDPRDEHHSETRCEVAVVQV